MSHQFYNALNSLFLYGNHQQRDETEYKREQTRKKDGVPNNRCGRVFSVTESLQIFLLLHHLNEQDETGDPYPYGNQQKPVENTVVLVL